MHTISVSDHCSVANNTHEKKKENKKEKDAKKQGGKKGEATGTEGFDSDSSELTDLEGS